MIQYPKAKINLVLSIRGKRPDGYHELDTVFAPLSLREELEGTAAEEFSFRCSDRELETPDNLVCRAYRLLKESCSFPENAALYLHKSLPSQAGLGGGSGDAAAALQLLNRLFRLGLSLEELIRLGARLGADVPALLLKGPSRGRGTGTDVVPIPTGLQLELLIVKPPVALSTPDMYRRFDRLGEFSRGEEPEQLEQALRQNDRAAVLACMGNDFDRIVTEPEVLAAHRFLQAAGAEKTLLCGSGSAVAGVFPDAKSRDEALKKSDLPAEYRCFACRTL